MHSTSSLRYRLAKAVLLLVVFVSPCAAAGREATINPETTWYDFHPSSTTTREGDTYFAWHGYRRDQDRIVARRVSAGGELGELVVIDDTSAACGPPTIVGESDDSIRVIFSRKVKGQWQVVLCSLNGKSGDQNTVGSSTIVSDPSHDAIYPSAVTIDEKTTVVAWSAYIDGRWRVCCRQISEGHLQATTTPVSNESVDAFRSTLVVHDGQVWCFWDEYRKPKYSVRGRAVHPTMTAVEAISPAEEYCLRPTAMSHPSGLHVAWLRKQDVIGGPGVISQWHSLHAAVRGDSRWRPITTSEGETTAADLTHGLMAKIDPRPVATGGYLGPRLRASWLADGEQVWLLWERKSNHRGSTPTVSGDLVGRPSREGRWQAPVVLKQGQVDYHAIDPPVTANGEFHLLASPLPRRGIRQYVTSKVALADSSPLEQEQWTGWRPVSLPLEQERTARRTISVNGEMLHLFWADLHCHNGLTADAEGEPDEMHFYAKDRAQLDVVVFTNNDFYNVPLTQYDFQLGHLFATTFSRLEVGGDQRAGRRFLSLPGFEWTSRIPGTSSAQLSDPGNWLPPYRNRSYPNHRSVIYPPSGGPLVHFTEVDNDIARLNEAVAKAGGITLSQHSAFKLSGHPVEVGFELTSGWSNYIASRPQLFHAPLNGGARLGFTANGDTHRRAPGLSGALTAIYAKELTPEAILEALKNRRCYATMGSHIFLDARAGDVMMGSEAKASRGQIVHTLRASGTRDIKSARLIRNGKTVYEMAGAGTREVDARFVDGNLPKGTHWYYWRVEQTGSPAVLPGNMDRWLGLRPSG